MKVIRRRKVIVRLSIYSNICGKWGWATSRARDDATSTKRRDGSQISMNTQPSTWIIYSRIITDTNRMEGDGKTIND